MATIEKRTSDSGKVSYRAKVRLRGFPPQNATFEKITDARKWVQDTESSIREGRYFKTAMAKKHTLKEMIVRYRKEVLKHKLKSTKNQLHYLQWWESELGHYTLADVTADLIVKARNKLIGKKNRFDRTIGTTTANRYSAALGHVFTMAINEWGWLEINPVRKIKKYEESRGRVRFLDEKELSKLLDACKASENPHLYTIVVMALSTGARKSELTGLRWKDIDLKRQQVVFHKTKNNERRVIPLRGRALALALALHKEWVKISEDVRPHHQLTCICAIDPYMFEQ